MGHAGEQYWQVTPLRKGNNLPKDFLSDIPKEDRVLILNKLEAIEKIRIPREWPNFKVFPHDGENLNQLTAGNYRIYLHLTNIRGKNLIVVCYICRKSSQEARKKDLNRAVTNMRVAMETYRSG